MSLRRIWPASPAPELSDTDLVTAYAPAERNEPRLRMNFVTSADGAGALDGRSGGLSSAPDKQVFGVLRMLCDVLLVGAGTLRAEGYRPLRLDAARRAWRREAGLPEWPTLAVVSGRLALDPDHPALAGAPTRPVVVTHAGSPVDARNRLAPVADVIVAGDTEVDLAAARTALADRGLRQMLCEGGPELFSSLLAADLVDELCLTVAPLLAGPGPQRIVTGHPCPPRQLRLVHVLEASDNLMLRYARIGSNQ